MISPSRPPLDAARSFAVVVHDLAPAHRPHLDTIAAALSPRVGAKLVGAVVPCWHGVPLGVGDADFRQLIRATCGEVVQHGYTHRQVAPGLISLGSGRSNELSGLSLAETRERVGRGREILTRTLGVAVAGFTPPAWQVGRASMDELARQGFDYLVGFGMIRFARSPPILLATWSWDWGIIGPLGRVGETYGAARSRLRPDALPCVVVHPADVARGFLPRVVRVVDRLSRRGRTPVTFADLARSRPAGATS